MHTSGPFPTERGPKDKSSTSHDLIYRRLRTRVLHGEVLPGEAMTLRGIAAEFGVSMTPAREAVRRLTAEGALTLSSTGRITTPVLSNERIEELAALRALLEPELSSRALPRAHAALIDRMDDLNRQIHDVLGSGDAVNYVRLNLEFHRMLYLRAQAPAMLALAESVWLQLGPSMRALYSEKRRDVVTESHGKILAALRAGDEPGLRVAVRADVTGGLRMLLN
ncbi:MAG: GntR family transcriptional regulator [Rhodobacteraceae bacterium]|nr:GntR family transcriptional regulator [Paracoccaceae bacterium]